MGLEIFTRAQLVKDRKEIHEELKTLHHKLIIEQEPVLYVREGRAWGEKEAIWGRPDGQDVRIENIKSEMSLKLKRIAEIDGWLFTCPRPDETIKP